LALTTLRVHTPAVSPSPPPPIPRYSPFQATHLRAHARVSTRHTPWTFASRVAHRRRRIVVASSSSHLQTHSPRWWRRNTPHRRRKTRRARRSIVQHSHRSTSYRRQLPRRRRSIDRRSIPRLDARGCDRSIDVVALNLEMKGTCARDRYLISIERGTPGIESRWDAECPNCGVQTPRGLSSDARGVARQRATTTTAAAATGARRECFPVCASVCASQRRAGGRTID
jgi:hypothetical protein